MELSGKYKGCNVILIILDAMRPDYLSCYGYSGKTSPNIDALADKGVIFLNAFSTASYTMPGVASLFTSLYPYSHNMACIVKDCLPDTIFTLAQILDVYGYNTAWFGDLADPHSGAAKGMLNGFKAEYGLPQSPDSVISGFRDVRRWINKNSRSKFFLTVHSYITHERLFPFLRAGNKFDRLASNKFKNTLDGFRQDRVDKRKRNRSVFIDPMFVEESTRRQHELLEERFIETINGLDKREFSEFIALLDSAIYEADDNLIGGIVAELKARGIYDKTIIIITADHGNEYMEHGSVGHGAKLYDESIRVPLIYYLPGLSRGVRVKRMAQSIDVLPTLLGLLSIPAPEQAQGVSLIGLLEDKKHLPVNEFVFSQGSYGIFSIRSREWKYTRRITDYPDGPEDDPEHLFDLRMDKSEKNDLKEIRPEIVCMLRDRLEHWQKSLTRYYNVKSGFPPEIPEEMRERIRKTGYW